MRYQVERIAKGSKGLEFQVFDLVGRRVMFSIAVSLEDLARSEDFRQLAIAHARNLNKSE